MFLKFLLQYVYSLPPLITRPLFRQIGEMKITEKTTINHMRFVFTHYNLHSQLRRYIVHDLVELIFLSLHYFTLIL